MRANGGVPATIGIINGVAKVGLSGDELIQLASTAEEKSALKVSRRDLGYICGMVGQLACLVRRLYLSISGTGR